MKRKLIKVSPRDLHSILVSLHFLARVGAECLRQSHNDSLHHQSNQNEPSLSEPINQTSSPKVLFPFPFPLSPTSLCPIPTTRSKWILPTRRRRNGHPIKLPPLGQIPLPRTQPLRTILRYPSNQFLRPRRQRHRHTQTRPPLRPRNVHPRRHKPIRTIQFRRITTSRPTKPKSPRWTTRSITI
jgi:hypothetical protein